MEKDIKRLMKARKLTFEDMARILSMDKSTLSCILNGNKRNMYFRTNDLQLLAKLFQVRFIIEKSGKIKVSWEAPEKGA